MMFEVWSHHRGLCPLLFSNSGVGSFYIPQEPGKCKACFKRRATAVLSWLDCNTTWFQKTQKYRNGLAKFEMYSNVFIINL